MAAVEKPRAGGSCLLLKAGAGGARAAGAASAADYMLLGSRSVDSLPPFCLERPTDTLRALYLETRDQHGCKVVAALGRAPFVDLVGCQPGDWQGCLEGFARFASSATTTRATEPIAPVMP